MFFCFVKTVCCKILSANTKVIILTPIQSFNCGLSLSVCSHSYMSQFGAEFRRFSLDRSKPGRFDEFYGLLQHVHRIPNVDLLVGYADVHGDLLPINNNDNYHKAISVASPLLRLFLQRKGKKGSIKFILHPKASNAGAGAQCLRNTALKVGT
ncbi:unnamed protein product [Oncorhynchus mykiss]|uniref:PB1 domain-containing protein n=1 Tax=Oncorhynchus mykiss TaxID=8022 RepID=A0A060X0V9_ONCMY|nr:unnamed protein product [Oncorhynchus mykiss]